MSVTVADVAEFVAFVHDGDTSGAVALALRLVDDGEPVANVLSGLVGTAQVEVGDRWHRNEYTVADEHAATAVADAVVSVLTAAEAPPAAASHIVVACAESEWHVLAAKLAAEIFRAEGFRVTFLGPSMPAAHLGGFLERAAPDAVALSCSTPLAFNGVVACVEAAHQAGVPVVLGGRALGTGHRRAETFGADVLSVTAAAAVTALREPIPPGRRESDADIGGALDIARQREAVVMAAMHELAQRLPGWSGFTDRQRALAAEDFTYIVQFAEAAVLVRDRTVFDDFVAWLESLLLARGLHPTVLPTSLAALAAAASDVPAVLELLEGVSV